MLNYSIIGTSTQFCVTDVNRGIGSKHRKGDEILNDVFVCAVSSFMFLSKTDFNRLQRERNRKFVTTYGYSFAYQVSNKAVKVLGAHPQSHIEGRTADRRVLLKGAWTREEKSKVKTIR
jgi:hypothetical protein